MTHKIHKILIIATFLFLASVIIMPLAMPYCGTNGFNMGFMAANNFCGSDTNLAHISFMRGLIFIGMVATVFIFVKVNFNRRVFSLMKIIRKSSFNNLSFLFKHFYLGRMKPFDKLLLAYSSGIVQPKTF